MDTYEEARKEYCRKMGDELGTIYHLLWNECVILHMRWEEYVELFGKTESQFDTMNATAPGFFKSVQDMSWESTLLHLCRFADPAIVSGKRTLSLLALTKTHAAQAVPRLSESVSNANAKIKFAQDWRHRHIAHADLEHAMDKGATPLASASRAQVREALAAIVVVLEAVENHFTGRSLMFMGPSRNWGGTHLLSELKLLARLRSERKARMENGSGTADDFDYKKWH